jgi:hypothetical protein
METAGRSAALNQGQGDIPKAAPSSWHFLGRVFDFTLKGFVNFYDFAWTAHWSQFASAHRFANAVSEVPSGFHAALKHALDLAGGDALLAGAHQVDDLKPKVQRQVRRLENGAHAHGEGLAALIALIETLAGGLSGQFLNPLTIAIAAMMANRAVRPKARLNVSEGFVFVLKVRSIENRVSHSDLSYGINLHLVPRYVKCNVLLKAGAFSGNRLITIKNKARTLLGEKGLTNCKPGCKPRANQTKSERA